MLPNLLAGVASLGWGVADFLGGFASRRLPAMLVTFISQVSGLAIMVVAVVVIGGDPAPRDVWLGVAGGMMGGVGISLLYRSLALGPMNVAAPATAVFSTAIAVVAGVVFGESLSAVTMIGLIAAVIAIVAVSQTPDSETIDHAPGHVRRTLLISICGGLLLGAANVCYSQTAVESGIWPAMTARLVATGVLLVPALRALLALRAQEDRDPPRRGVGIAAAAGLADAVAAASIFLALQRGSLVLVGVLGGLFPVVTVLLARVFLKEHLGRPQLIGLGFAVTAVVLLGVG